MLKWSLFGELLPPSYVIEVPHHDRDYQDSYCCFQVSSYCLILASPEFFSFSQLEFLISFSDLVS